MAADRRGPPLGLWEKEEGSSRQQRQCGETCLHTNTWPFACTLEMCGSGFERLLEGSVPVAFSWEREAATPGTAAAASGKGAAKTHGLTESGVAARCLTVPGVACGGSLCEVNLWVNNSGTERHTICRPCRNEQGKPTSHEWQIYLHSHEGMSFCLEFRQHWSVSQQWRHLSAITLRWLCVLESLRPLSQRRP